MENRIKECQLDLIADRMPAADFSGGTITSNAGALLLARTDLAVALGEMARDPKVGRAEALRRSMLALIDKGDPHEAHPAYWAPFIVVGEGGRGR